MSLTLGQDEVFLSRRTRLTSEREQEKQSHNRRRTISTGFEQGHQRAGQKIEGKSFTEDRKTQSFSTDIPMITRNLLRKISTFSSFQEDAEEENQNGQDISTDEHVPKLNIKKLPGFSIVLNIIGVIVFQLGNVLVKRVEVDLIMLLLIRDIFISFELIPFTTYYGEALPPTKFQKMLLIFQGVIGGLNSMAHYYAVTVLPLGDVMMISAVKLVFITFFSCIFLKEACGMFEILNISLTVGGILLVVKPPFIFGDSNQEYTTHMFHTAMILMASNAMVSLTAIISRQLRDTHWSVVCFYTKLVSIIQLLIVSAFLGSYCLPGCGLLRFHMIVLSLIANIAQVFYVICLQNEEAHIIGFSDNASNIIVSQIFQVIFFIQIPKLLTILGFLLVLTSMILIGVKKVLENRRQATVNNENKS